MCSPQPAARAGKVHFRGLLIHQRVMDVVDPGPGRIHVPGKSVTWSVPRGEPMAMGRHRRTWTPPSGPRAYLMLPSSRRMRPESGSWASAMPCNRVTAAVERTVPFGFLVQSLLICWYASYAYDPADVARRRMLCPWYITKTEPSTADMLARLRREFLTARWVRRDGQADLARLRAPWTRRRPVPGAG